MPMFRRNLITVEARQMAGNAAETMDVVNWIRNRGEYPWLMGNATRPETLIPEGSDEVGGEGVYIDPATGELVIHAKEKDTRVTYGDWVICDNENKFEVMNDVDFRATYNSA